MNYTYMIDVAHWWKVDYDLLPDYVKVVAIKATEGDYYEDDTWRAHLEGTLRTGRIPILYHFYRTKIGGRLVKPITQAEYFLDKTKDVHHLVNARANDFERGEYYESLKGYYNPVVPGINSDLLKFHQTLHDSGWKAFDLLYTGLSTWQEMGLENAGNLWQGPSWVVDAGLIDGLWLAWWPIARPKNEAMLAQFDVSKFSPRLPRPFKEYWTWQVAADYSMPGVYVSDGSKPRSVDFNIIPHPYEEVAQMLGAYEQPPVEPPVEEPGEDDEMSDAQVQLILQAVAGVKADIAELRDVVVWVQNNLASHHLDVMAFLEGESGIPPIIPPGPLPEEVKAVLVKADNAGGRVFLSVVKGQNGNGAPIFQFYPDDSKPVKERVFVPAGAMVLVKRESRVKGDGGAWAWEVADPIPYMSGSQKRPEGVRLYLLEKFIV